MQRYLVDKIKKDKLYDYLKQNSYFIKQLTLNPNSYEQFKKYIKEKYHLRLSDKINNALDDIDLITSVIETLK